MVFYGGDDATAEDHQGLWPGGGSSGGLDQKNRKAVDAYTQAEANGTINGPGCELHQQPVPGSGQRLWGAAVPCPVGFSWGPVQLCSVLPEVLRSHQ